MAFWLALAPFAAVALYGLLDTRHDRASRSRRHAERQLAERVARDTAEAR
jgi:hypothetical protein